MVVASRRGLLFLENMVFWIFKTCQISRISSFANIWSNFGSQLQSFVESRVLASNYAGSFVESGALASNRVLMLNQEHWPPGGGVWGR